MIFEDIQHKYKLTHYNLHGLRIILERDNGALIGYFPDECIARNVALALEFYKEKNKMIDAND